MARCGRVTYESYLRLGDVLDAPRPLTPPNRKEIRNAERFFMVCHQTSELWLSQAFHDLLLATEMVASRSLKPALALLLRARSIIDVVIVSLQELYQLDREHFMVFRTALQGASGAQSRQFRLLLRGLDNPLVLNLCRSLQACDLKDTHPEQVVQCWEVIDDIVARAETWQRLHVDVARRFIGDLPGTGGTTGVDYLLRHGGR
jgi:tryptophan 2,3-dioxygenase